MVHGSSVCERDMAACSCGCGTARVCACVSLCVRVIRSCFCTWGSTACCTRTGHRVLVALEAGA
eukprot:1168056-Rhodomonas_salina.3